MGASRAGFDVIGAVDFDPHAIKTHSDNFTNTLHKQLDISKISLAVLKNELNLNVITPDGIIAGTPCQGFSMIGRKNKADPRNHLFVKTLEIIAAIRPRFFIVENVPGIYIFPQQIFL